MWSDMPQQADICPGQEAESCQCQEKISDAQTVGDAGGVVQIGEAYGIELEAPFFVENGIDNQCDQYECAYCGSIDTITAAADLTDSFRIAPQTDKNTQPSGSCGIGCYGNVERKPVTDDLQGVGEGWKTIVDEEGHFPHDEGEEPNRKELTRQKKVGTNVEWHVVDRSVVQHSV